MLKGLLCRLTLPGTMLLLAAYLEFFTKSGFVCARRGLITVGMTQREVLRLLAAPRYHLPLAARARFGPGAGVRPRLRGPAGPAHLPGARPGHGRGVRAIARPCPPPTR